MATFLGNTVLSKKYYTILTSNGLMVFFLIAKMT